MAKTFVIFLDLLGFGNYVKTNLSSAAELLSDSQMILSKMIDDNDFGNKIDESIQSDSFNNFIPISDSILITSDDVNKLVKQLSHFLLSAYELNIDSSDTHYQKELPIEKERSEIVGNNGGYSINKITEEVYPVLYRGGGAYGEFISSKTLAIKNSEVQETDIYIGKGIVEAVKIEESGIKGPRILVTEQFFNKLNINTKNLFCQTENDNYELLWTYTIYNSSNKSETEINKFGEIFNSTYRYWNFYKNDENIAEHYFELLRLIVKGTLAHFESIGNENIAIGHIKNFSEQDWINEDVASLMQKQIDK